MEKQARNHINQKPTETIQTKTSAETQDPQQTQNDNLKKEMT